MIKIALSTLACPDWSVAHAIDATQRYGYDAIELGLIAPEVALPQHAALLRSWLRDGDAP